MPFVVTEPQRIDGTKLGYSVYPYHFSFQDHFEGERNFNQKVIIFKLKDSPFIEIDKTIFEERLKDNELPRGYLEQFLKKFVVTHPEYIVDTKKVKSFFERTAYLTEELSFK